MGEAAGFLLSAEVGAVVREPPRAPRGLPERLASLSPDRQSTLDRSLAVISEVAVRHFRPPCLHGDDC